MKRKIKEKLKAIELREKGYSLNEIIKEIGVAKSSASAWVRNILLSKQARKRLLTRIKLGQLISAENKRFKIKAILDKHRQNALKEIELKKIDNIDARIICSLIYWCEGAKDRYGGLRFTNSDPILVQTFLNLLQKGFGAEKKKFSSCIHLHQYHDKEKQLELWSKITGIPKKQFIKPFIKSSTGKRIRKNYPGCISIRCHNTDLARQLLMTAEAFFIKYGGVVQW